jgi:hypothetical protein
MPRYIKYWNLFNCVLIMYLSPRFGVSSYCIWNLTANILIRNPERRQRVVLQIVSRAAANTNKPLTLHIVTDDLVLGQILWKRWPQYKMEVSAQLHAPAALPPVKQPPVPITFEAGWAPQLVWALWRKEKSCFCRELKPSLPARNP